MKMRSTCTRVVVLALSLAGLATTPTPSGATSLAAKDASPGNDPGVTRRAPVPTKDEIVAKYVASCLSQPVKQEECGKVRTPAVEIIKEDLHTLGSSANRTYMPTIVKIFRNDEALLRIAAADAIGMIGPQDQDVDALAIPVNDPVPDVRRAVWQAITRGKGSAINLLVRRVGLSQQTGLTPDVPPDASKFSMPVAPDSTYLFYDGNPASGWLSYMSKGTDGMAAFYKGKAKKGPLKLDDFQDKYRYQLQDEQEALDTASDAAVKQLERQKPPDTTDIQGLTDYLQKMQSASAIRFSVMGRNLFQPELFGAPTVYILEERQIGQRSYPTRYVVLYQDLALKRPGYRMSWTTVPDDAIRAAQATSLAQEKEELANKAESEAIRKKQAELDALTRKKDDQQKKQFKKGQEDLEKELGF